MDMAREEMREEINQEKDGMIEAQDLEEEKEVKKDIEAAEKKTMGTQEPRNTVMGEEAMITAGKEEVHEVAARRLLA